MRDWWEVSPLFKNPSWKTSGGAMNLTLRKRHPQRFFMRDFQKMAETPHQSLMTGCPHAQPPSGSDAFL